MRSICSGATATSTNTTGVCCVVVPVLRMLNLLVGMLLLLSSFGCLAFTTRSPHRLLAVSSRRRRRRTSFTHHHMFTGIVEEIGTVIDLRTKDDMTLWDGTVGKGTELTIGCDDKSSVVLNKDSAYLGCSICVSGVCLTATHLDFDKKQFKVGLAPETLRCTYFDTRLKPGDHVNLERASEIGGRNSGHFVQGHVDCTGDIIEKWKDEDSLFFKIRVTDETKMPYIVPKGFIAIDGTSLTVVDVNTRENWFTFMLVAYTQSKIIIPSKQIGDKVNIEVDVLGKYSSNALMTTVIPRLEALEAQVGSLQKQLEEVKNR